MQVKVRPDRETFDALAAEWPLVPMWTELLADVSTPVGLFPALAGHGPGLVLLESVERSERWGRYSFVAGDPAARDRGGARRYQRHGRRTARCPSHRPRRTRARRPRVQSHGRSAAPRMPELPPLTGGLMGYLAYEAAELLDGHPVPRPHVGAVSRRSGCW